MALRVVVLTTRLFARPSSGGEACTARLLAALMESGHQVEVAGYGVGAAVAALDERSASGTDVASTTLRWHSLGPLVEADRPFAEWPRWRRASHIATALLRGSSSTMLRLHGADRGATRATLARLGPADVVIVDHLQAWPWAQALSARTAPILLMHNLESDGYAEYASEDPQPLRRAFLAREARLLARLEGAALAHAGAVACLSERDAEVLRARAAAHGTHVEVLPGYPQTAPCVGPRTGAARAQRHIGLIGTWSWGPNRRALEWLLREVVPRLPPACRVQIAGSGAGPELGAGGRDAAQVEWLGRVADVANFYAGVDVVAVPAVGGSGVQEKAIEAIGTGLPLVATGHALRGLGPGLPDHVYCADTVADFAHLCATVRAPTPARAAAQLSTWREQRERAYRAGLQRCIEAARVKAYPVAIGA